MWINPTRIAWSRSAQIFRSRATALAHSHARLVEARSPALTAP
eukprot:SAG11_NODE_14234_length_620_cov_1.282150_1_plen_42_part_10